MSSFWILRFSTDAVVLARSPNFYGPLSVNGTSLGLKHGPAELYLPSSSKADSMPDPLICWDQG